MTVSIFAGDNITATMNETFTVLADALSTMVTPLATLSAASVGTTIVANETGRVIPAPSSRACGAWNTGQHNLFQTAEIALIIGSVVPHR